MKTLGETFKELRKKNKFSQDYTAEKLNVSKATISYIESNKRFPGAELLRNASTLFNVELSEFYRMKIQSTEDLSKDMMEWLILGDELKQQGISPDQVREWVKVILAFGYANKKDQI